MKISEINPNQGNIDLELDIVSVEETREFEKYGKVLKVANAVAKDDSGTIKMSFWNEDIDKIKPGMKIKLTNGYCSEFQGEKQLSAGKFGSFEVLGEGDGGGEVTEEKPSEEPEEEQVEPSKEPEEQVI